MKSKNFILTIAVLLCATFAFAQTGKGKMMIGGTANFDVDFVEPDNIVNIGVNPQLGFFVIDNLAVGGVLEIANRKQGDNSTTFFGIAPFGRYYFGSSTTKLFVHGQVGYRTEKFDFNGNDGKVNGSHILIGPGVAFFLNDHVAIEGLLGYNIYGGDFDHENLGLLFGVQAYIGE